MSLRKTQLWGLLSTLLLALLLVIPALAQGGPPPPNPGGKGGVGKITAVSASSITVTNREGDAKTFAISSSTTITLDGKTVTADGLTTGNFAEVASTDGTNATNVRAHSHPPPPPGQGPPPDGQGPPPDGPPPPGGPPPGGPPPDGPPMGPPPDDGTGQ